MRSRKQKIKKVAKRNNRIKRENIERVCESQKSKKEKTQQYKENKKSKPGRKPDEKKVIVNEADLLKITVEHFFKDKINNLIAKIKDPRDQDKCTYSLKHITWLGILMFIFRLGSRQQLKAEKDKDNFLNNLLSLSNSQEDYAAHTDTMNYLFKLLPPEEFANIKVELVKYLIKNKVFDSQRLFGSLTFAIDATDLFTFKTRHCEHCLVQEHNDETTTYSHKMEEVKLVGEIGFAISVLSESIENVNGKYAKQDCELNSFYRLAPKLYKLFTRTQICLLLDGLYACENVFAICKKYYWEYMIVLKPKKIPTLYEQALKQTQENAENSLCIETEYGFEKISWAKNIKYKTQNVNVIFSTRVIVDENEKVIATLDDCWVTNIMPRANNIEVLIKKGGRQRWKIENQGFKEQKCDDFELEHLYGKDDNAWKNYYQLLQIAHFITHLIKYSDLITKLQKQLQAKNGGRIIRSFLEYYVSTKDFVFEMRRKFLEYPMSTLSDIFGGKIQIRFSSG